MSYVLPSNDMLKYMEQNSKEITQNKSDNDHYKSGDPKGLVRCLKNYGVIPTASILPSLLTS